jgi:hypothetical protein
VEQCHYSAPLRALAPPLIHSSSTPRWRSGECGVELGVVGEAPMATAINSFIIIKPGPGPGGCMFAIRKHSINEKDGGSIKSVDK